MSDWTTEDQKRAEAYEAAPSKWAPPGKIVKTILANDELFAVSSSGELWLLAECCDLHPYRWEHVPPPTAKDRKR